MLTQKFIERAETTDLREVLSNHFHGSLPVSSPFHFSALFLTSQLANFTSNILFASTLYWASHATGWTWDRRILGWVEHAMGI